MTNKLFKIISSLALVVTSLTACGTQTTDVLPLEGSQQVQTLSADKNVTAYSENVQTLMASASKLGVKLKDEQLRTISIQRHVKPSGEFAARPAEKLTSDQNLTVHFNKHGKEFNIKTKELYLKSAIDFQNRKSSTVSYYFDTTSFDKGYQSNVVKYDSKTHEFGAMKSNGDITTYYTNNTPSPKRFVPVPEEFNF